MQDQLLYGLVLAGGKSSRMGRDKGAIQYHAHKPHRQFLYELLEKYCAKVFLSCRKEQANHFEENINYQYLFDPENTEKGGPLLGIQTAMRSHPQVSWLIVACDMPYIDEQSIQELISARNPEKMATVYQNPDNKLPEPLIAIWEGKSLSQIEIFLSEGINCPRKILIKSDILMIEAFNQRILANINYPEEFEQVVRNLNN